MALANKDRINRRKQLAASPKKRLHVNKPARGRSPVKGSRVGDDLVEAFEEMAKHLRGEIYLRPYEPPSVAMTPAAIKAIRLKVAASTKEFERLFGVPARTMEAYEQGRRNPDGAMRTLLRIIDREPKAALKALAA
ncbi:MAG: helix-turn-helix domain-containing protein [Xanthobacteraceae bacterium]